MLIWKNDYRKGETEMPEIKDTLEERKNTHGDFKYYANCAQMLKAIVNDTIGVVNPVQKEALEQICGKMARICTGNSSHADHWHDIAGYATLAEKYVIKTERSSND